MSKRKRYKFEVVAADDEIVEFGRLLSFINHCASTGHAGTVEVTIDGDGSAGGFRILDVPALNEETANRFEEEGIWIGE